MSLFSRHTQAGQRLNTPVAMFSNLDTVSSNLQLQFCATRRARVSKTVIGRVLFAMLVRRLQPTDTTKYSRTFDDSVRSMNGIVPEIMNVMVTSLPLFGSNVINGELINCGTLVSDQVEADAYIASPDFARDLQIFKAYAQAQSVVFVPICCNLPMVHPSTTMRISAHLNTVDATSVPKEYRTATVKLKPEEASGKRIKAKIAPAVTDVTLIAEGKADLPEPVESDDLYEHNSSDPITANVDDYRLHTSAKDDIISTSTQAFSALFPMAIYSLTPALADWFDGCLNTRGSIELDSVQDQVYYTNQAVNVVIRDYAAKAQVAMNATYATGQASSRFKSSVPVPAAGVSPDSQLETRQPIASDQVQSDFERPGRLDIDIPAEGPVLNGSPASRKQVPRAARGQGRGRKTKPPGALPNGKSNANSTTLNKGTP